MIEFPDKCVSYETFLNDLAARIVQMIKDDKGDPEMISQRKAFSLFGRSNVERWKKQGKIIPSKRPGKIEYPTAQLRVLQRIKQDY